MHASRFISAVLGLGLLVTLAPTAGAAPSDSASPASGTIPGRYIVTLVDDADAGAVAREYRARGADVDHIYRTALRGFAGAIPASEVERLRADARVERVEADGWAHASALTTQSNATWGLDRVDERERELNKTYTYETTATNVTAYVIDTGIRASHTEFSGRMLPGFSSIDDRYGTDDCNGHGTHVAGTIGGTVHGVAKGVSLVPVRVLNCRGSGTWSGVIAGVDWVTANARKPAVANMSLGGGANSTVDDAVRNSISAGVVYALAAGNDSGTDACTKSPARVLEGLTVGATTSTDARASYSNIGTCLDLFAPGSSITSAWIDSDTDTNTISGTSMATPHVAGAAALWLSANPSATASQVNTAVVGDATANLVGNEGAGSPDLLLHSLFGITETVTAPATPADFTATDVSSSSVTLTWGNVAGETDYVLTRATGTGAFEPLATLGADVTTHTDTTVTASTAYTYRLVARNGTLASEPTDTPVSTPAATGTEPVGTLPVAAFIYSCTGGICDFDGTGSTGADSYSWSGSFVATTATTSHEFTSAGNYTVTLTVANTAGTDVAETVVSCSWSGKGRWKTVACQSSGTGS